MKLSGIYIFVWWPFFALCGADVVHMWYYTKTGVVTVGKLAQSFFECRNKKQCYTKDSLTENPENKFYSVASK